MKVNVAHLTEAAIRSQVFQVDEDLLDDANDYSVQFEDTVSVHTGIEVELPTWQTGRNMGGIDMTIRGGFAYLPSPLVSQGPQSAFLDADRLLISAGVGVAHKDAFQLVPGPVKWDAFHSRQRLAEGELSPEGGLRAGAPIEGRPIPVGGQLWSTGVQCSVSF